MTWKYFNGNRHDDQPQRLTDPPDCPPWRHFLPRAAVDETQDEKYWQALCALAAQDARSIQRAQSFRVQTDDHGYSEIVDAVNAAIHLRRPLLVTGAPGAGKTSSGLCDRP